MSSDPATPLLTVEGLLEMVAERNAMWARATVLSEQIDYVRKFIGEEKFTALVGNQEVLTGPLGMHYQPLSRRGRSEVTIREVILEALAGKSDGLTFEDLRGALRQAGLGGRSPNSFFNAVARMHEQGEAVKVGDRVFSVEDFARLTPGQVAEIKKTALRGGIPDKIIALLKSEGRGLMAGEVIAALKEDNSSLRDNAIYATLSRLTKDGTFTRDEHRRYWMTPEA